MNKERVSDGGRLAGVAAVQLYFFKQRAFNQKCWLLFFAATRQYKWTLFVSSCAQLTILRYPL